MALHEGQNIETESDRTDVAIAVIVADGRVLICKRPEGGSFAGYWEFPGGKREPAETVEGCLVREVAEELAIDVQPRLGLQTIDHDYPAGRIRLHPYLCAWIGGQLRPLACQEARWVDPRELPRYRFPPANDSLISEVVAALRRTSRPAVDFQPPTA